MSVLVRGSALSTRLPRALAACAPLVVLLALAPSALATPFSVVISNTDGTRPATLTAGQETTVKATIANHDSSRSIGSANLTAPAGLQVVSATPGTTGGTATVAGSVVQLRNILIPKGTSRDLTIRLRPPTSAAGRPVHSEGLHLADTGRQAAGELLGHELRLPLDRQRPAHAR